MRRLPPGARQPATLLALAALLGACAALRPPPPIAGPQGARLHGLGFGSARPEVEAALRAAGLAVRPDPDDAEILHLDRCPGPAPSGPCRLLFGPAGLYASEQELTAGSESEVQALVGAVTRAFGPPDREPHHAPGSEVAAHWERAGWTVALSRPPGASRALLRAEWDAAAPPVVAGVPLGRRRAAVEAYLLRRGAVEVDRDAFTTSYLGCPDGTPSAHACVVEFHGNRAAAVVEVSGRIEEDWAAQAAWRARSAELTQQLGRPPTVTCPEGAIEGCLASWSGDRLAVVVGAQRGRGGRRRGALSVYVAWAYPPLLPRPEAPLEPGATPAWGFGAPPAQADTAEDGEEPRQDASK